MLRILIVTIFIVCCSAFAFDCSSKAKDGLRIFISFSMPTNELVYLDKTARKLGAKLVIRGLKNNSFKETFAFIHSLSDQAMVVDIDPKAFEKFEVNQVPSFVINEGDRFDKLTGNVSIAHVLKEISANGELKEKAAIYLERLENEKN